MSDRDMTSPVGDGSAGDVREVALEAPDRSWVRRWGMSALGAGGTRKAIILLVVILVVQNVVQTVIGNRLTSSTLALHPIAALISTIVGASLAGLLGATLSAPILAGVIAVRERVSEYPRARDTVAVTTGVVAVGAAAGPMVAR